MTQQFQKPLRIALLALGAIATYAALGSPYLHFLSKPPFDKLLHISASFVLTLLLRWSMQLPVMATLLLATCIGGGIELLQFVIPHHSPGLGDFLADIVGAVIAGVLFHYTRIRNQS